MGVCDSLAAIGHPIADKTKPNYAEVVPLLQSYETWISLHSFDSSAYTAFYGQRNNSKFNSKGSRQSGSFSLKG